MAFETHDLALALAELESSGSQSIELVVAGVVVTLVRLAAGDHHEHTAALPSTLLVLEGVGTIAVDDWRATLAGGILIGVPARSRLVASADAGVALSLLLTPLAKPDA